MTKKILAFLGVFGFMLLMPIAAFASSEESQTATSSPLGIEAYIGIAFFAICYILIAFEHQSKIDKSGLALLAGSGLWVLVALFAKDRSGLSAEILHESQEIFSVVVFLLAAMTIVETLLHYGLFDWIQQKISERELTQSQLFWILGILTFLLSAILDNLTTTLIMVQVGRKIYTEKQSYLIFVMSAVIAANAGGAFSPLGDVTTIILWLAGKFSALEIIVDGFLPSVAVFVSAHYLLSRKIKVHVSMEKEHKIKSKDVVRPNWTVITVGLLSFTMPIFASLLELPPFLGLLFGLGILWVVADLTNREADHTSSAKLIKIIQKTDVGTLKFFIGILLAVGALGEMGILTKLSSALFGGSSSLSAITIGSTALGALSAILDNVPLVAAAIDVFPEGVNAAEWVLLAITAGTGGSMLVVGSAAGVAAMGQVPELTFGKYLKIATLPAAVGFLAGIAVWLVQYQLLYL